MKLAVQYDPISGLPVTTKKKNSATTESFSPVYAATQDPGTSGGGPAHPGSFTLQSVMPDYKNLIASDPQYQQTLGSLKTQGIQSAAQRALARQRALIQFGSIPDFGAAGSSLGLVGGDIQNDIDPETVRAAAANNEAGLSTSARLGSAHAKAVRDIQDQLTARGLARSGATGYQLDEENQNYAIGQNDATSKLLDYLAGVQAAFTQGESDRANAANAAAAQAGQTQATLHPPSGAQELKWDPAKGAYGPAADGRWYNADGSVFVPPETKTKEQPPGTTIHSNPNPATISDYNPPAAQATVQPPTGALNMPGGVSNTWGIGPTPAQKPSINELFRLLNGG